MELNIYDSGLYILLISAIAAAISFAVVVPVRARKRDRYKDVIERTRRTLFEQARQEAGRPDIRKPEVSAREAMISLYKVQSFAGQASVNARNLLLQAGYRDPNAPMIYLAARVLLPIIFLAFSLLLMSASKKEISPEAMGWISGMLALFGFFIPRIIVKNTADKRQQEIAVTFPDALDMMLICVQGGIGIEAAINRIAAVTAESSEILAEELGILSAELGLLNDRKAAYQGFAVRAGSGPARSFATAMVQAEQYGTSISKALRTLAEESREVRMAAAEQKAASLPPKLTVPMILFFLPPLFVIILGPAFLLVKH